MPSALSSPAGWPRGCAPRRRCWSSPRPTSRAGRGKMPTHRPCCYAMQNGRSSSRGRWMAFAICCARRPKRRNVCARIPPSPVSFPRRKSGESKARSAGMQRHQLEHIIRAATGITGASELLIIGRHGPISSFYFSFHTSMARRGTRRHHPKKPWSVRAAEKQE